MTGLLELMERNKRLQRRIDIAIGLFIVLSGACLTALVLCK